MNARREDGDQTEAVEGRDPDDESADWHWNRPKRSDQAPGEDAVQVNDAYVGGDPTPEEATSQADDQHRTGG